MRSALAVALAISLSAQAPIALKAGDAPSLSHGFRYGMSPQEAAAAAATLPGITKATVSGSRKSPALRLQYADGKLNQLGFEFVFSFTFVDSKLVWVDLVGQRQCKSKLDRSLDELRERFEGIYGSSNGGAVWHQGATDVYLISIDDTRQFVGSTPSTGYLLRMSDLQRQCGDQPAGHILIRYKGNPSLPEHRPSEAEQATARAAVAAKTAKDQADRDAFNLSK